jgi:4-amino-4-deoxy-L-arabinose transferase-like glycosyltransferase
VKSGRAIAALIVATTAIRLLMAWALGLGIDESYMVAAGRALHLSYFDHPPLSWWMAAAVCRLVGSDAAWVVRLPFIATFAVSTWLIFRLTSRLFDETAGIWAALALNLAPVFAVTTGGWVLPDGPLICFLLAAALCLVHALESRRNKTAWWLAAGLAAGLALLSKYSAVLVLAGAFAALLTQPAHRHWLARPQPYLAAALALLVFSPVLVWNAGHAWASFAFQGDRAAAARFQPFGPIRVFAGEALFLLPWIWLGLMAVWLRGLRAGPAQWQSWLLCCLASGPILLFAVVSLWSRNVLFHWASPGYLFLFPLLGAAMARWPRHRAVWWAKATAILVCAGLLVVAGEIRLGWLARLDPRLQAAELQAVDWTPLRATLAARGLLHAAPIAAPNWTDAGKIDYALGGDPAVLCLNTDSREYGFAPGPRPGQDILIVAPRQTAAQIAAAYGGIFDAIDTLPPAQVALPGHGTAAFPLFLGHHLKRWPP